MVIIHQNNLEESKLLKMVLEFVPRFGTKWLFSGSWPMDYSKYPRAYLGEERLSRANARQLSGKWVGLKLTEPKH